MSAPRRGTQRCEARRDCERSARAASLPRDDVMTCDRLPVPVPVRDLHQHRSGTGAGTGPVPVVGSSTRPACMCMYKTCPHASCAGTSIPCIELRYS